jgi:hypothetical protein
MLGTLGGEIPIIAVGAACSVTTQKGKGTAFAGTLFGAFQGLSTLYAVLH